MDYKDLDQSALSAFVDYDGHEIVRRFEDEKTGLIAFIAVHNTNIGPALGGCRIRPYASEQDAIEDVLRLSRGMTYKNAAAGLPLGGGKAVVIADPYSEKNDEMIKAMGRAVETLDGQYISAEDSGLSEDDVRLMYGETQYVTGFSDGLTGGLGGNPSPATAHGVYCALKATVKYKLGADTVDGLHVAIQGLGAVGYALCRILTENGARVTACEMREDVVEKAQEEFPALQIVPVDSIFDVDADIFAPCAMGAQLNDLTIPRLKVDMVVGAANNQLATMGHGQMLAERGILYAPDYVVNAGGVIFVSYEYFQRSGKNPFDHALNHDEMMDHVERATSSIVKIFERAERDKSLPHEAADRYAESIFMTQSKAA